MCVWECAKIMSDYGTSPSEYIHREELRQGEGAGKAASYYGTKRGVIIYI